MKLFIAVVLTAALLAAVQGGIPAGKNVKTSVKQMNWLEKMLLRKFQPKQYNKMMTLESKRGGDNSIQDGYSGSLELMNVELPLTLLQLVKMGDDIYLPTFQHEYGWWFCFFDICDGFNQIYNFNNARLKTVSSTTLHASMDGSKLRLEFKIPNLEIDCPECTYDYTDYGQDPPATSENTFYRGYSLWIKNYTVVLTGDFGWNFDRIDVTNFDLSLEMDEFWDRQWNATHTFPDGTTEEWGPADDLMHERMLEDWNAEDGTKGYTQDAIKYWLNCYLSNGKNNKGECDQYFNEPLHNMTSAELLHAFGLGALNNYRASQKASNEYNLKADDPIETMNSIIFDFGTHVMQTSKYAAALYELSSFPLARAFTWVLNKEICSDNSTGNAACENFQEQITIGAPLSNNQYSTLLHGAFNNRGGFTFDTNTISYSFNVPDVYLTSTDFQRILTNVDTGVQYIYSGLDLNIMNCAMGFVTDYAFEDGHFVISNFKMNLQMYRVTMDIPDVIVSDNGEWTNLPSVHHDAAPMVMELWESKDQDGVSFQERYQTFVQDKINDFLAGRTSI